MISVILNVYNGEQYIERCINSVLAQTYKDFELIIVDDGSTDGTTLILDRLAKKHDCINLWHNKNMGIGGSRHFALQKVKGDYMISLDSDDYVDPTFLESLYNAITEQDADLAICDYVEERETGSQQIQITERENVSEYTRDLIHGRTWSVVWNKLIKTSIVKANGIDYDESLRYWEDVPFSICYSLYCNKIAWVHKPLYHYVKTNDDSLTTIEGVKIKFNTDRVQSVKAIDYHLEKIGKSKVFDRDMLWIKFWIKDAFIIHECTHERIALWRDSFPEVNSRWRDNDGGFHLIHWALVSRNDHIVMMHATYWQLRHQLKSLIQRAK